MACVKQAFSENCIQRKRELKVACKFAANQSSIRSNSPSEKQCFRIHAQSYNSNEWST